MNLNPETQSQKTIWQNFAILLNGIQARSLTVDHESDLLHIFSDYSDILPFSMEEFSIIYQDYGNENPEFVIKGESGGFVASHNKISDIIHGGQTDGKSEKNEHYHYFKSRENCKSNGFKGFTSILIVPMRLNEDKNIGVFILHSKTTEDAYSEIISPLDAVSDRLAFILRSCRINRRAKQFQELHNLMLRNKYETEEEILQDTVNELVSWFKHALIHIVLINPFNLDEYLLVCDSGRIIKDFRKKKTLDSLDKFAGNSLSQIKEKPLIVNERKLIKKYDLDKKSKCKSWLGARMQTATDMNIGFIFLHNNHTEGAYAEGDEEFVDEISDFLALLLVKFRNDQRISSLDVFSKKILSREVASKKEWYKTTQDALNKVYGKAPLAIVRIGRANENKPIGLDYNSIPKNKLPHTKVFLNAARSHLVETSKIEVPDKEELTFTYKEKMFLVAPMRIKGYPIGGFIIPAQNVGPLTARYIDHVSDRLAIALDYPNKKYERLLLEFGRDVGKTLGSDLSLNKIISLVYETVSEVMDANNFYLAMYNTSTKEVSFPFALKNGTDWKKVKGSKRQLNKKELGKTEKIILSGESIIHYMMDEAKAWYESSEHKDHAEEPLAAWIGVPVFAQGTVIAVMATYHDTDEFVYTMMHLRFLELLGNHVSLLFTNLSTENSNKKLKEAQGEIAEQQHILSTSMLAQDLKHRVNNTVGGAILEIEQAEDDIGSSGVDKKSGNLLSYTKDNLLDTRKDLKLLLHDIKEITSDNHANISLNDLIAKICRNVDIGKKLSKNNILVKFDQIKGKDNIFTRYRTLSNGVYAIVDNAGDALLERARSTNMSIEELVLHVSLSSTSNYYVISISDNGSSIPKDLQSKIFDHGVSGKGSSGFGLWRAKTSIDYLSGTLKLKHPKTEHPTKCFEIKLPREVKSTSKLTTAWVLDDERSWRRALKKWLVSLSYKVTVFSDKKAIVQAIEKSSSLPDLVTLDISLTPNDGSDIEGLSLIEKFKGKDSSCKVVVVTGYEHNSTAYENDYDLLLQKFNDDGVLDRKKFTQELELARLVRL